MSDKLVTHSAAIAIMSVALTGAAPAQTSGAHGVTHFSHVSGHGIGSVQFGTTSHFGQLGVRLGGAYGDRSQLNGGWYSRGFGGTLDPGWGYRFGPSLGGF